MKKGLYLLVAVLLLGCASIPIQEEKPNIDMSGMARRFISLQQVEMKMSRAQVKDRLGEQVVIGYEISQPDQQYYNPITIVNPFRTEAVQKESNEFIVDYYLAGIVRPDNQVSDDELLPMVFYQNHLIGIGWDFLEKNIKN